MPWKTIFEFASIKFVQDEQAPFAGIRRGSFGLRTPVIKPGKGSIGANWNNMTPYWRWVAELYHDEMVRTYGSVAAVNQEFMLLGVVKTLQEERFRWQN